MTESQLQSAIRFLIFSQKCVHKGFFREYANVDPEKLQGALAELEKFLIEEYDNLHKKKQTI